MRAVVLSPFTFWTLLVLACIGLQHTLDVLVRWMRRP